MKIHNQAKANRNHSVGGVALRFDAKGVAQVPQGRESVVSALLRQPGFTVYDPKPAPRPVPRPEPVATESVAPPRASTPSKPRTESRKDESRKFSKRR